MLKGLLTLFYLGMIVLNGLANALPLGGRTTGAVSDQYPSLFTPSGVTFSIWGLIYLLLGVALVVLLLDVYALSARLKTWIIWLFILSCAFNMLWLLMWHYDHIVLSTVVMLGLFAVLLILFVLLPSDAFWLKIAFSLYVGWISVALIANVTIMLVALSMPRLGLSEAGWLIMVLFIGLAIGVTTVVNMRDVVFGVVFIWAYGGILWRHVSSQPGGYASQYPSVIMVLVVALLTLSAVSVMVFVKNGYALFK